MNASAFGTHPTIRAAVRAAESLCALPAVPTLDWCDRAARALMAIRPPSIALVMFARLGEGNAVARVETVGVAGCTLAEVSTTFGRVQSVSSIVPLGATHPATGSVRSGAHTCRDLGWSPAILGPEASGALPAAALDRSATAPGSPLRARWAEAGAADFVVGAAPLTSSEPGRYVVVELGFTGSSAPEAGHEEAALLAAALPLLVRRAAVAFGPRSYAESACLTHREEVVLEHILDGKSVRKIAGTLGRSPHTVHDHVKSLHRKLGATSRGALVARALGYAAAPAPAATKPANGASPVITFPAPDSDAVKSR